MTLTLPNQGTRVVDAADVLTHKFTQWLRGLVDQSNYALTFAAVKAALATADSDIALNGWGIVTGAGSELTPALVIGALANGGMYSTSNTLYWTTNLVTRMRLNGGNLFVYGAVGVTNGNVFLYADASGKLTLTNVADSDFDILRLGGNTSSCPAIKKLSAALAFKLADDSAYTTIVCATVASGAASISSAAITGTSAGQLGHAQGVPIVAALGAGYALEFVSGVIISDFATAAYTGGGNVSFAYEAGGATLSAVASYANSVGGAADKIALVAASVPTNNQLVANKGINLVCAAAPTNPGTAAGVLRVKVTYRIHTTGL